MAGLVLLAARWLVAAIFLRSGLSKVPSLKAFRSAVANYKILPAVLVKPAAFSLPFAEITAAVLLAAGIATAVIAAVLSLLLLAFAAAIAVNLARGRVFDCGCGGSGVAPSMITWRHVVFDLLLAAAAAAVAVAPPSAAALWPGPAGLVDVAAPGGGALPVLLAVVLCLVMAALLRRALTVRNLLRRF